MPSTVMKTTFIALLAAVIESVRSRGAMQLEILALRHQLAVYQRTSRRPRLTPSDRLIWGWLASVWSGWRDVLVFVKPETVVAWQRKRFRDHWTRPSRQGKPGRPQVPREVRELIRTMSRANPLWGSPRIRGELRKIGIELARSTVEKSMVKSRKPSSPTWRMNSAAGTSPRPQHQALLVHSSDPAHSVISWFRVDAPCRSHTGGFSCRTAPTSCTS